MDETRSTQDKQGRSGIMKKILVFMGIVIILGVMGFVIFVDMCENYISDKILEQTRNRYHNTLWLHGYISGRNTK